MEGRQVNRTVHVTSGFNEYDALRTQQGVCLMRSNALSLNTSHLFHSKGMWPNPEGHVIFNLTIIIISNTIISWPSQSPTFVTLSTYVMVEYCARIQILSWRIYLKVQYSNSSLMRICIRHRDTSKVTCIISKIRPQCREELNICIIIYGSLCAAINICIVIQPLCFFTKTIDFTLLDQLFCDLTLDNHIQNNEGCYFNHSVR